MTQRSTSDSSGNEEILLARVDSIAVSELSFCLSFFLHCLISAWPDWPGGGADGKTRWHYPSVTSLPASLPRLPSPIEAPFQNIPVLLSTRIGPLNGVMFSSSFFSIHFFSTFSLSIFFMKKERGIGKKKELPVLFSSTVDYERVSPIDSLPCDSAVPCCWGCSARKGNAFNFSPRLPGCHKIMNLIGSL